MSRTLTWLRVVAFALALGAAGLATLRWWQTSRFVAEARHASGRVEHVSGSVSEIGFLLDDGRAVRFSTAGLPERSRDATVPVAYVVRPDGSVDARVALASVLWAGMWGWVEAALGLALVAVYGRAIVEEPLSVIGFKSWRVFGKPGASP